MRKPPAPRLQPGPPRLPTPEPAVWSAESAAMAGEDRRELLAAVARLPRRAREVLALRCYLELNDNEIAAALGISRGTVSSTASRAYRTGMSDPAGRLPPSDAVLSARGVDLVRGDRTLLSQITVTVRAGEQWALLGPNGAGKSTLLRIFATYAHPTRGQVDILGRRLGRVDVFALRPLIGYVTSHHPLTSARSVREVVLTGATGTIELAARWAPSPAELARADGLIGLLGLGALAPQRWPVLSQGERSRTLIARALMARPRLLLLDEPAAGLDIGGREQLLESLDELRQRQPALACVLVTHHLEELPASTSHAMLLRGGALLAAGPADEVLATEPVSTCFDYPVAIARHAGRWASVGRPGYLGPP